MTTSNSSNTLSRFSTSEDAAYNMSRANDTLSSVRSRDHPGGDLNRMKELMTSYYGMGDDEDSAKQKREDPRDINSASFEVDQYVKSLLMDVDLSELLRKDETLVRETKTLDSDMQMLVYENYNKFISATDTIRKMKINVESMEEELKRLETHITAVGEIGGGVNQRLAPKRSKVEKLVGVRRLLKRLEFLLQLPQRLKKSIELQAYSQTVKYYNMTSGILKRYSHISSFQGIQRDADAIIHDLKGVLVKELNADPASMAKLKVEQAAEYAELLLQLKHGRSEVRDKFVAWIKMRLGRTLDSFADPKQREKSVANINAMIEEINQSFLKEFVQLMTSYKLLFISGNYGNAEPSDKSLALSLTKEAFGRYFTICKKLFQTDVSQQEPGAPLSGANAGTAEVGYADEFARLIEPLRRLSSDILMAHSLVKGANLTDRAAEVVETAVRFQVDLAFRKLREVIIHHLRLLHYHATDPPALKPEDFAKLGLPELSGSIKDLSSQVHTLTMTEVELVLRRMHPLIQTSITLQPDMAGVVSTIVQGHFRHFVVWINRALLLLTANPKFAKMVTVKDVVFPLGDKRQEERLCHSEDRSVTVPILVRSPQFILVLACLARDIENAGIQRCIRNLQECIPSAAAGGSGGVEAAVDTEDLKFRTRQTAQELTGHFVEMHGKRISFSLRQEIVSSNWLQVKEPREVRPIILSCLEEMALVVKSAAPILGESPLGSSFRPSQNAKDLRRNATAAAPAKNSRRAVGVTLDIERIFAKKLKVFKGAELTLSAIIQSLFVILAKTFIESVRACTFSKTGFQQIQVDVHFLRILLPTFLEDPSTVEQLLDEVDDSAADRCTDPVSMDQSALVAITSTHKAKLKLEF